jgi:hypothetical protein
MRVIVTGQHHPSFHLVKEIVMKRNKCSLISKAVLVAALAASAVGVANADDNSMSRVTGDSYAYFASEPIDKSPSAWRQSNPDGEPMSWYRSNSMFGMAWKPAPVLTNTPSDPTFKQTHPNGLTESELMALSSNSVSRWRNDAPTTSAADTNVAQGSRNTLANSHQ